MRQRRPHVNDIRRKNHVLGFTQPFSNEAHLPVETLHAVLTTSNTLRVLVVDQLSMTDVAVEGASHEVYQLVDFQGGE